MVQGGLHPFHQVVLILGGSYMMALVCFFCRHKATAKQEELRSRKRVEYTAIVFTTSAVTLTYLVQGFMTKTAPIENQSASSSGFLQAFLQTTGLPLSAADFPSVSSPLSSLPYGLYPLSKVAATYVFFLAALRIKDRLQNSYPTRQQMVY